MAVVAVVALDCFLLRPFVITGGGLLGLGAVGLAVSVGLIGVVFARGRTRRFAAGFVITGCVVAAVSYSALCLRPMTAFAVLNGYTEPILARMPARLTNGLWLVEEGVVTEGHSRRVIVIYPSLGTLLLVEALV